MRVLDNGQVFFDYGPVSMVVNAVRNGQTDTELIRTAFPVIDGTLQSLGESLAQLRKYPADVDVSVLSGTARVMAEAVIATGDPFLTPMAAVAGSVSDAVADHLAAQGAEKVSANNGGDIAIRLTGNNTMRLGVVSDLKTGTVTQAVTLTAAGGIGGVATSGLGGRSLTQGIASAVTVFSERCAHADALATLLANRSYLKLDAVQTIRAGILDPESDIADLDVVTHVGALTDDEKEQALAQVLAEAETHYKNGLMRACIATVQHKTMLFDPEGILRTESIQ